MNNISKIDFIQRNVGIDLLRAVTMFIMIFVNDFWKIHDVPHWLEHSVRGEDFMGLADIVFPSFLFVVGMSIPYAIERRYSKGFPGVTIVGHIFSRTLALLVMGAFITNSEARLSPDVSYKIGVYWILMVLAFICIWNQYPKTEDKNQKILFTILKITGVIILFYLSITFRNSNGDVFTARWGILGTIGWTYLLCALIYLFTRDRLKYLIIIWISFVVICILNSRMKDIWMGTAILEIPRPNFYNDILSILHIGNGTLPAFTMGGVIFSLFSAKSFNMERKKKGLYLIITIAFFCLAGFVARKFWILSKLSATPTWLFYVIAIAISSYALLSWIYQIGKADWLKIINPAGTATLTCYLMPYVSYGLADLTGIVLPDWFTHGFLGIINCLCFALLIIGVTWLLGYFHIKLKI